MAACNSGILVIIVIIIIVVVVINIIVINVIIIIIRIIIATIMINIVIINILFCVSSCIQSVCLMRFQHQSIYVLERKGLFMVKLRMTTPRYGGYLYDTGSFIKM